MSQKKTELVPVGNSEFKGVEFATTGLSIPPGFSFDKWESLGGFLSKVHGASLWWWGDWLVAGEKLYPDRYSQALEESPYEYQALKDASWVARSVLPGVRRSEVEFTLHRVVAPLTPEDQGFWLEKAAKYKWTRKQLQNHLKLGKSAFLQAPAIVDVGVKDINIRHGEFPDILSDIKPESVDLILTDPPYGEKFLPLWGVLASFSFRVLKPGAMLIAYSGQTSYLSAINQLSSFLTPLWVIALLSSGTRNIVRGFTTGWKPVLVFQKPPYIEKDWGSDVLRGSGTEKDLHEWQQAEAEAIALVERFSPKGGLIVDPFLGSGTNAVAAYRCSRRLIGCDNDQRAISTANARIKNVPR